MVETLGNIYNKPSYYTGDDFTPLPDDTDDDNEVEFYVEPQLAHWCLSCDRQLDKDEALVFVINKQQVSAVIKRDLDNLTKDEIAEHTEECEAAQFDELKRWHDLKVCRRKLKKEDH